MLVQCGVCGAKNNVFEVLELKDIKDFTDRLLIISKCKVCRNDLAQLIEVRKIDNKPFTDTFFGTEAQKVIKRELRRLKNKRTFSQHKHFQKWVYGLNKEYKNKKGDIVRIKHYACDFATGNKRLEKTIVNI